MVIREKHQKHSLPEEFEVGGCWIGVSLAKQSGLIISTRVGKYTDELLADLVANTEGNMDCKLWYTDAWGGYEQILPPEMIHIIGKLNTQRLERTNGIIRQQTVRWHRRQNKFGKLWEQTDYEISLPVQGEAGYFSGASGWKTHKPGIALLYCEKCDRPFPPWLLKP